MAQLFHCMYTKHKTQKTKSFADGTCLVSPPSKIVIKDSSGALVSTEFSLTICQDILKNGTTDFETERFLIQLGDQIPIDGIPQVDEIQKGKLTQPLQNTRPKLINKPQARNPISTQYKNENSGPMKPFMELALQSFQQESSHQQKQTNPTQFQQHQQFTQQKSQQYQNQNLLQNNPSFQSQYQMNQSIQPQIQPQIQQPIQPQIQQPIQPQIQQQMQPFPNTLQTTPPNIINNQHYNYSSPSIPNYSNIPLISESNLRIIPREQEVTYSLDRSHQFNHLSKSINGINNLVQSPCPWLPCNFSINTETNKINNDQNLERNINEYLQWKENQSIQSNIERMSKEWSDQLTASKSSGTPSGKKRALLNKHALSSPTSSNRSLQRTDAELILALSSFLDKEQH